MISLLLILLYVMGCRACRKLWTHNMRTEAILLCQPVWAPPVHTHPRMVQLHLMETLVRVQGRECNRFNRIATACMLMLHHFQPLLLWFAVPASQAWIAFASWFRALPLT